MFHGLKYKSPLFTVEGIGTFKFLCRYPSDADVIECSAELAALADKEPTSTPATTDGGNSSRLLKARAEIYARFGLQMIEDAEINGEKNPEGWRDAFAAADRPGFVGSMLRSLGVYLFRGPAESSDEPPGVAS